MEEKPVRKKRPAIAFILSAIFPGVGQVYNNQLSKGISIIALNMVINLLLIKPVEKLIKPGSVSDNSTLFIVAAYTAAGLVLWLYAILDAKKTAEKINRSEVV